MTTGMQQEIIERLQVSVTIDVQEEIRKRVSFLKEQVMNMRATGLLIAIDGSVEHAVAAGLCKKATDELTQETGNNYMTMAVFQPYGDQDDLADSYMIAKALSITHTVETNVEDAADEVSIEAEHGLRSIGQYRHLSIPHKQNVKARIRMTAQFALAEELNLLVVGTIHASSILIGSYTKWGDGAADVQPLARLNLRQIGLLAVNLDVPHSIIDRIEATELDISIESNCDYLEGKQVDPSLQRKIEYLYRKSEHKRNSTIFGI